MILKLQLYSLIGSFGFGIFVYLTLELMHKLGDGAIRVNKIWL